MYCNDCGLTFTNNESLSDHRKLMAKIARPKYAQLKTNWGPRFDGETYCDRIKAKK